MAQPALRWCLRLPAAEAAHQAELGADGPVEEVWIKEPSRVFVARNGRQELTNVILSRAEVQELVERMLKSSGRRIDLS